MLARAQAEEIYFGGGAVVEAGLWFNRGGPQGAVIEHTLV